MLKILQNYHHLTKPLVTIAFLCFGLMVHAQHTPLTVKGVELTITKNTNVSVKGNLVVNKTASKDGEILNSGNIYVSDSIINHCTDLFSKTSNPYLSSGIQVESAGTVVFNGDRIQPVSSFNPYNILFNNMDIINSKGLMLNDTVCALGKVSPITGSLFLNGKNLELFYDIQPFVKYDGRLGKETNKYKVWDTTKVSHYNLLNQRSGHIVTKYNHVELLDTSNLGITTNAYFNGISSIERGHLILPYAGNGSIRKYFIINTADKFNGTLEISYLDSSDFENLHIKEPDFRAFLNIGNSPVTFSQVPGSIDTALHIVKGDVKIPASRSFAVTIADSACDDPPKATIKVNANVCAGIPYEVTVDNIERVSSQMLYFNWYKNGVLLPDTGRIITDTLKTSDKNVYRLKIYDNRGCFSYSKDSILGRPIPVAGFKADKGAAGYCLGTITTLTDTSRIADNSSLVRTWLLDDGTTSTLPVVTHTYTNAATYAIKLITTSIYGCSDTTTHNIEIHPLPNVRFTIEPICDHTTICANFINSSDAGNSSASVTTAKWGFGVNDTVLLSANPLQTVNHCYTTTGSKKISLTLLNNYGCASTYFDSVKLSRQTVAFNAPNVCLGNKTNFNNLSIAESGIPSYYWDFGDNTTSTATNPQKTYTTAGSYDVTLYMQTGNCTDSLTKTVWVNPLPSAAFSAGNACVGSRVDFTPANERLKAYSWSIDGSIMTMVNPSHVFPTGGTFPVVLTVTSDSGCNATSTSNVEIYSRPKANFTFRNVCLGNPVSFYNQSTVSGGSLTYRWTFDDNDRLTTANPEYIFSAPAGNKSIELIATSNHGCADTIVKSADIYPLPAAGLASSISTCVSSYILDATVNMPGVTVSSYTWNNGWRQPTLTVTRNDSYSVDITSTQGCKVTETVEVILNTKVDPRLPNDTSFCGQGILDALYPDANCTWSTGEHQRKLTVTQNGWYSVTINDQNSCTAKDSTYVTVHSVPQVTLGSVITGCAGTPVTLDAGANFNTYSWSTGENTRQITIISQDRYKVTVADANGCTNTAAVNVTFLPVPPKPLPNEITQCKYAIIDAGISATSYLWSTGENTDIIRVNKSGDYWVKVSNGYQCYTYDTVKVNILSIDDLNLGKDISVCEGTSVTLDAGQHGSEYTYIWNRQTSTSPLHNVIVGGRYIAELLNNTNGCSAKDTIFVQFMAGPRINLGSDRSLCNSTSLTMDAGNEGSLIQWGSSNGLVSTQQTIDITGAGKYWVTVVNENGCIAFDTVQIYPSSGNITAEFIFDSDVYAGDTVNFCNVSFPAPYTSNWQFGDGVISTTENPSHVFYYAGTFNVLLAVSNEYCSYMVSEPIIVQPLSLKKHLIGDGSYGKFVEITSSKLYPNPNKGDFTLELKLSDYADIRVAIFDLKGSLIAIQKFDNLMELTKSYSLKGLSSGVYILKAMVGNKNSKAYKIIKY